MLSARIKGPFEISDHKCNLRTASMIVYIFSIHSQLHGYKLLINRDLLLTQFVG